MKISINTIPQNKEDSQTNLKVEKVVEDRNKVISKKFGVNPYDVDVNLYYSTSQLVSRVGSHDARLGVFSGYVDYEDSINIAHPLAISPIFGANLDKQISIMVDYTLIKMYLCKIFYPNKEDYRLYYKYLSEYVAKLVSGNFVRDMVLFEVKNFSEFKKYKKDIEIFMALFVILEKSGADFIFSNLKKFFEDCDIKKSLMKIYKKEFKELVGLYQKELLAQEKSLRKIK